MIFKFKTVVFSLVSTLVLSSCFNQTGCIKLNLSKEEVSWFTTYKNNDTVFFKNELNEIDTFLIDVSTEQEYTVCNRFELGPYIYASMGVTFNCLDNYKLSKNDKNLLLVFDKIGQDSTDTNSNKFLEFFELETKKFQDFSQFPVSEFSHPNGNTKIKSYIFTSGLNCSNSSGKPPLMDTFAITKEFGLVWYKTINGHLYERIW